MEWILKGLKEAFPDMIPYQEAPNITDEQLLLFHTNKHVALVRPGPT